MLHVALALLLQAGTPPALASRYESHDVPNLIEPTLDLREDGTYTYRNWTGSCWTSWEDNGVWQQTDGLLVLRSVNLTETWVASVTSHQTSSTRGLRIVIRDHRDQPVESADIRLGDGRVVGKTNRAGALVFSPEELSRVVGRRNWITVLTSVGGVFAIANEHANDHVIRVRPAATGQKHVTYLMPEGATLTQLGTLNIKFSQCPE